MAGTISLTGLGSGMDTAGMIDALVEASSVTKNVLTSRAKTAQAAATTISDISSLLAKFKTAVDALSDPDKVASYAVSSSDDAKISASVTGAATEGKYAVEVTRLAETYRAYSNPVATLDEQLGISGPMTIQIGSGEETDIEINPTDSLSDVVTAINGSGLRVRATTVYDGSQYRLQLRGLDAGDDNAVTVTNATLGLDLEANLKQQAQSAQLNIDGFSVTSASNSISGMIPGVTLNLSAETTGPVTIETRSDPTSLATKLGEVVATYNAVIAKIHTVAGYGSQKATSSELAGDQTLRQITTQMSRTLSQSLDSGNERYQTLRSLGIEQNRDGTLSLDQSALSSALAADPTAVSAVLAGKGSADGVMDLLANVSERFTTGKEALLVTRKNTFEARIERYETRIEKEEDRLASYRERLEAAFGSMETLVSGHNATMDYLTALYADKSK